MQVVRAAMNPGNDVLHVENGERRIPLVQLAVLSQRWPARSWTEALAEGLIVYH